MTTIPTSTTDPSSTDSSTISSVVVNVTSSLLSSTLLTNSSISATTTPEIKNFTVNSTSPKPTRPPLSSTTTMFPISTLNYTENDDIISFIVFVNLVLTCCLMIAVAYNRQVFCFAKPKNGRKKKKKSKKKKGKHNAEPWDDEDDDDDDDEDFDEI